MNTITILYDFLKEMGGLERVMVFQANSFKTKDINLIFSYIDKKNPKKILSDLGLKKDVTLNPLGKNKSELLELFLSLIFHNRLKNHKTDLILSHSFTSSMQAYNKKKLEGTPYIVFLHHPPNFLYNRSLKWANNVPRLMAYLAGFFFFPVLKSWDMKSVRYSDLVISNSKYTANRAKKIYNVDSFVVYPPISKEFQIRPKSTNQNILSKFRIGENFVLMHGRIINDKKPEWGISAFHDILSDYPDLHLVISGTIEDKNKLERHISKLGLNHKVHLIGIVSKKELVALYNSARCFLMTSPKEDFGMTSVEAIACGCPVVAWKDGGGQEEIIKEGKNGYLAEPYSIKDFSAKIKKSISDNFDKLEISKSVNSFSEDKIREDFIKLINSLRLKA